jgi:hypothetical protein
LIADLDAAPVSPRVRLALFHAAAALTGARVCIPVGPGWFHLRTWCAGRYKLGIQTFPNPLPPRYTTPPYTGPSGTSIYFEVSSRGSA